MKGFTAIAVLAVLAPTTAASAAVHSGQITFKAPASPPSIGPSPPLPVDEQSTYLQSVALSYDDVAGSVTISVAEFEPAWWGTAFGDELQMRLANTCLTGIESAADQLNIDIPPNNDGVEIPAGPESPDLVDFSYDPLLPPTATATLGGYVGQVSGPGAFDGTTFTFTLSDPTFASQDWRCATLSEPNNPPIQLGGWPAVAPAAPAVTAKRATASQVRKLTAVANAHHTIGFSSATQYLSPVRVTNNGWAYGQIDARNPKYQGNAGIFFRRSNGSWRVAAAGSDYPSVPTAVQKAVGV